MFYDTFPAWQEDSVQSRSANDFRFSNSAQISWGMVLCFSHGLQMYHTLQQWAEGYDTHKLVYRILVWEIEVITLMPSKSTKNNTFLGQY